MKQPEPVLVAPLFPELLSELLEVLSSLTLEEWENPTSCPGWTVQDIASHLLDVEVGQLSRAGTVSKGLCYQRTVGRIWLPA